MSCTTQFPVTQREYFLNKFRPLAFLVYSAVCKGKLTDLCAKIKMINGELPKKGEEQFKPNLFKDYSTGMTLHDMQAFVDWILLSSPGTAGTRDRIMGKLKQLKVERYAHMHVYCEDGRVPEEQSM